MTTKTAIAATIGLDTAELSDYRYHATRLVPCVYIIDESYICAKPETVAHLQMYNAYQNDKGPEVNAPNTFDLVSQVQSKRGAA